MNDTKIRIWMLGRYHAYSAIIIIFTGIILMTYIAIYTRDAEALFMYIPCFLFLLLLNYNVLSRITIDDKGMRKRCFLGWKIREIKWDEVKNIEKFSFTNGFRRWVFVVYVRESKKDFRFFINKKAEEVLKMYWKKQINLK